MESRTCKVCREETIPPGQGDGIGEDSTRNSVSWAQSGTGHGDLCLLRLQANIRLQVIDMMIKSLGGSLERERCQNVRAIAVGKRASSRQFPHFYSTQGKTRTLTMIVSWSRKSAMRLEKLTLQPQKLAELVQLKH